MRDIFRGACVVAPRGFSSEQRLLRGIPYLWNDALCLIHAPPEDKKDEISPTRDIFRGACVVAPRGFSIRVDSASLTYGLTRSVLSTRRQRTKRMK